MDKPEFIKRIILFCQENKIKLDDCYISHGGACLMLGVRNTTRDIDLNVYDKKIMDKLVKVGYALKKLSQDKGVKSKEYVAYDYNINVHLSDKSKSSMKNRLDVDSSGICYTNAVTTLDDKLALNRDKDQDDIKKLRELVVRKATMIAYSPFL